jgi:uncharacterized membrane protein YedE/YeeE
MANEIKHFVKRPRWSPYWVGTGIGVLSWVTFGLMNKALGVSTTMVRATGTLEKMVSETHVLSNEYFTKYMGTAVEPKPIFEWQFALVVMLAVGAYLSVWLTGERYREEVPRLWKWRFGPSRTVRNVSAFIGGAVLLFGARLAGGCTSGHGISGGLQLALSSWLFFLSMFISGVVTAFILYGKKGGDHV